MGGKQCTSAKNELFIDVFENSLSNRSVCGEKKVRQEYFALKKRLSKVAEEEDHLYGVKNYDKPKNQINKFKKWLTMSNFGKISYDSSVLEEKKVSRSKLMVKEQASIEELKRKLSDISDIITPSSKRKIGIDELSSKSEITQDNYLEYNLRDYHQLNKYSFLDKLYKGPPVSFRFLAWLIAAETPFVRIDELYFSLLEEKISEESDIQIQKDLSRTFSHVNNCFNYADTRVMLYNLLRTICLQDKEVGYCQGMNFLAGFLLIVSDFNQVDSFYVLIALLSKTFSNQMGIRGFFLDGFPLLKLCMYQFHEILLVKLPKLAAHINELEIPDEVWIGKWFQTLFTICLPIDMTVRVWDCFFVEGFPFLFNFSVAMLKKFEKDLLQIDDVVDFVDYFKFFEGKNESKVEVDIEAIIYEAKAVRVTAESLNTLRAEYENKHKVTLSDLEIKYKLDYDISFVNEGINSAKSEYFVDNDEKLVEFNVNIIEGTTNVSKEEEEEQDTPFKRIRRYTNKSRVGEDA